MNELLKKIITIEEKAQQIVESGYDEEKNIRTATKSDIGDLESNILHKQQNKVDQLRELEFEAVSKEVKAIEEETKEKLEKIKAKSKEQKENWANQLVAQVLSR